jgi:hypothetical protein
LTRSRRSKPNLDDKLLRCWPGEKWRGRIVGCTLPSRFASFAKVLSHLHGREFGMLQASGMSTVAAVLRTRSTTHSWSARRHPPSARIGTDFFKSGVSKRALLVRPSSSCGQIPRAQTTSQLVLEFAFRSVARWRGQLGTLHHRNRRASETLRHSSAGHSGWPWKFCEPAEWR